VASALVAAMLFVAPIAWLDSARDPPYWDTMIAGVLLLDDSSGRALQERTGAEVRDEPFGFGVLRILNRTGTEVLEFVAHPGGAPHWFSEFRVRAADLADRGGVAPSDIAAFESGRGVRLGLTIRELVTALGEPHERVETGNTVALVYRCASARPCPGLLRANMPQYEGRYTFQSGRLTAFESGYPYP